MRFLGLLLVASLLAVAAPSKVASEAEFSPTVAWIQTQRINHHISKWMRITRQEINLAPEISELIVTEARAKSLDPLLIVAIMLVESSFNPNAVSHAGALGLLQVLPSTGEDVALRNNLFWAGKETLFDPQHNLRIGITYFAELVVRFEGHLGRALAAYNQGPTRVQRLLNAKQNVNLDYSKKVKKYHSEFLALETVH